MLSSCGCAVFTFLIFCVTARGSGNSRPVHFVFFWLLFRVDCFSGTALSPHNQGHSCNPMAKEYYEKTLMAPTKHLLDLTKNLPGADTGDADVNVLNAIREVIFFNQHKQPEEEDERVPILIRFSSLPSRLPICSAYLDVVVMVLWGTGAKDVL